MEPKRIHGRHLTAPELKEYIKAYAKMFKSGTEFPKATTMLAATAEANNANARQMAVTRYKTEMDRWAGPKAVSYSPPEELEKHHVACLTAAMEMFDGMANFGSPDAIKLARDEVARHISKAKESYLALNESR